MSTKTVPSWFLVPAILAGFLLAWTLKPEAPEETTIAGDRGDAPTKIERDRPSTSNATAPSKPETANPKAGSRTIVLGAGSDAEELTPEAQQMHERMAAMMDERQRDDDEKRIAELVAALELDPKQEAELREYFDQRRKAMAGMWSGGEEAEGIGEAMDPAKLEELMAGILSPEQQDSYEALKETERGRQVEARALRDLASVTKVVDLRPEQRDAVYQVLHDEATERIGREAPGGTAAVSMSLIGEGMGFEFDDSLLDMSGMMEDLAIAEDGSTDQRDIAARIHEAQQRRLDEQVARFEGILDEGQLTRYRDSLESRASFMDSILEASE